MAQCACPGCQARLQLPDTMAGKQVRCPKCKSPFVVAALAEQPAPKPSPAKASPAKPAPAKPAPAKAAAKTLPAKSEAVTQRRPAASFTPAKKSATAARSRKHADDDYDDIEPVRSSSKKRGKAEESEFPWLLVSIIGGAGTLFVILVVGGIFMFSGSGNNNAKKKGNVEVAANDGGKPKPGGDKAGINKQGLVQPAIPDEEVQPVIQGELPAGISVPSMARVKRATVQLRVTSNNGDVGEGSGFFALERGLVVTNAHVIGMLHTTEKPRSVQVFINSGEPDQYERAGYVLGADQDQDLALLKLDGDKELLPAPLVVDTQSLLAETQKVYIFGFPFGERLGKNITVSDSSISSIRKNKDGSLSQIQVNGGMQPGNSGGPVVDSRGNVIAVSVAIITGTQINFAVPGEKVRAMVQGRVLLAKFGEPFKNTDGTRMPVKAFCLDPMSRIKALKVDVWTGPSGNVRQGGRVPPAAMAGDTAKKTIELNYNVDLAEGDVPMPPVPAGHVLWMQPVIEQVSGQKIWDSAQSIVTTSAPPLERGPANLTMNMSATPQRTVELSSRVNLQIGSSKKKVEIYRKLDTDLLEDVQPRNGGGVEARYSVGKSSLNGGIDAKSTGDDKSAKIVEDPRAIQAFGKFSYGFSFNAEGKMLRTPRSIPSLGAAGDDLSSIFTNSLEMTSFELPQRDVQPLEKWTSTIEYTLGSRKPQLVTQIIYQCTYEGFRVTNGVKEAFVSFEGEARTPLRSRETLMTKVHGTAHLDIAKGYFSKVRASFRYEVEQDEVQAVTQDTTLTRTAGNPRGLGTAPVPSNVSPQAQNPNVVFKGKAILQKAGTLQVNDPPYKDTGKQSHEFKRELKAGRTYIIDMKAQGIKAQDPKRFDPYLFLEDPAGQVVAEDDDSGGDLDARIIYKANQTGQFRIIATCFMPIETSGQYVLTVTEVDDAKAGAEQNAPPPKGKQPGVNPKAPKAEGADMKKTRLDPPARADDSIARLDRTIGSPREDRFAFASLRRWVDVGVR